MNRLILTAIILLALLIAGERVLNARREAYRIKTQTVRPLPGDAGISADAIRKLTINLRDTTWVYQFSDGNWHYLAYQNVFGLNDRIKRLLEGVVESQGTVVAFDRQNETHYGFATPQMLSVELTDSTGNWQQRIQIGRSLPGRDANEAFMALTNSDTLFHMHADPQRLLHWERQPDRPPMTDPKVLPTGLVRRGLTDIHFTSGSVSRLERVEIEPDETESTRLQDGPTYEWYAQINGSKKKVNSGSVYAYISFLNRLKYSDLHPNNASYGFGKSTIVLIDDADTADTLDVGNQTSDSTIYIRHRTTEQVLSITQVKSNLLFPSPAHLDTLARPSVYDKAEPTGPFSFASP
ncbi:MAG: hypothetical protein QGG64_07680 [Candidatus Latescibacteria bacterium]|jgi:hypothetical protein|nr:hypothetical protein [Candidatus Latescibacterota bacterium]